MALHEFGFLVVCISLGGLAMASAESLARGKLWSQYCVRCITVSLAYGNAWKKFISISNGT